MHDPRRSKPVTMLQTNLLYGTTWLLLTAAEAEPRTLRGPIVRVP